MCPDSPPTTTHICLEGSTSATGYILDVPGQYIRRA